MGADQTAAIRPALRELFDANANNEADAESLCITFTVPERPDVWVQVMHDTVNAAYPRSGDPTEFLRSTSLPSIPDLTVESWQPKQYATWSHGPCSVDALAEFIDQLLVALHSLSADDYEIDVTFEHVA